MNCSPFSSHSIITFITRQLMFHSSIEMHCIFWLIYVILYIALLAGSLSFHTSWRSCYCKVQAVPHNMEPASRAWCSSREPLTAGKWVCYNAGHRCCTVVDGFQVTWDTLYMRIIFSYFLRFFWGSWVWNGVHSASWSDKLSSYLNKEVTVRLGKLKMQLRDSMCWPHVNPVPSGAVGKDCQRRLLSRPSFVRACSATDIYRKCHCSTLAFKKTPKCSIYLLIIETYFAFEIWGFSHL
jgi:hypothetical protein